MLSYILTITEALTACLDLLRQKMSQMTKHFHHTVYDFVIFTNA